MSWRPAKDREWRRAAFPEVIAICRRTWHSRYSDTLEDIVKFVLARVEGFVGPKIDVQISFERVPLDSIQVTNPEREEISLRGYPALRETLKRHPRVDSVPIVVGRIDRTTVLWDGHHRVSTYRLVGRANVPAVVVSLLPGDGEVRVMLSECR